MSITVSCRIRSYRGSEMSEDADSAVAALQERVRKAAQDGEGLAIMGGDTKSFLGRVSRGTPCSVRAVQGVVHYEPTELVVTVRAGTRKLPGVENRASSSVVFDRNMVVKSPTARTSRAYAFVPSAQSWSKSKKEM